jgi:tetratricopeptide (TPR) repeat protein
VNRAGLVGALNAEAITLTWLGEFEQAGRVCLEGFELINRVSDLPVVPSLHCYYAISCLKRGKLEKVEENLLDGLKVARRLDNLAMQTLCLMWLGHFYAVSGQMDAALQAGEESVGLAPADSVPCWRLRARVQLAVIHLERMAPERALQVLSDVWSLVERSGCTPDGAVALYELGDATLSIGDLEAAEKYLDRLFDFCYENQLGEYRMRERWLRARLFTARGEWDAALELLEVARSGLGAMGARLFQWQVDMAVADAHKLSGRIAKANAAYLQAWEGLRVVARSLPQPGLRETMLRSPRASRLRAELGFDSE